MKKIAIVLASILAVAILFSGVVSASLSYNVMVNSGTVYVEEHYDQMSRGLPYDGGSYDLSTRMHNCGNVTMDHYVDFDRTATVQADTVIQYRPDGSHAIAGIFFEEDVGVDKIARSGNETKDESAFCFTSDANFKAIADYINLETSAYTSDDRISYEVAAVGIGAFSMKTETYTNEGKVNGTATFEHYKTMVGARDTYFQFGGAFYEDIPELPPFVPAKSGLCPFMQNPSFGP